VRLLPVGTADERGSAVARQAEADDDDIDEAMTGNICPLRNVSEDSESDPSGAEMVAKGGTR